MASQHGEEEIIRAGFDLGFKGFACEVGAGDGIHLSNTHGLELDGWDVLCIEPFSELFSRLKDNRKRVVHGAW